MILPNYCERSTDMKPVEVADGIYWVGAIDWNIRDFHGYSTKEGTTYNAFLIMDEKITLIDTVKKEFADELIHNISQIVDPKKQNIITRACKRARN
jgi:flavorubredoxin